MTPKLGTSRTKALPSRLPPCTGECLAAADPRCAAAFIACTSAAEVTLTVRFSGLRITCRTGHEGLSVCSAARGTRRSTPVYRGIVSDWKSSYAWAVTGRSPRFPQVPSELRGASPGCSTRQASAIAASTGTSPDDDPHHAAPHQGEGTSIPIVRCTGPMGWSMENAA